MIRIGLVDSGIDGPLRARVATAADFGPDALANAPLDEAVRDRCGHGSRVAAILAAVDGIELLDARVFFATLRTSAAQAAAAIDWLVEHDAQLLNLSFGLHADRPELRDACERAASSGVLLVASAPARGAPVYPAGYPDVIGVTGDARCAEGQHAWLASAQAEFGASPRWQEGEPAGASAACAHICATLARRLVAQPGLSTAQALAAVREDAAFKGPAQDPRQTK